MWVCVVVVSTDVSEERNASIFRVVKNPQSEEPAWADGYRLSHQSFSTLKMEASIPPKRRFIQNLHSATSQNTAFFNVKIVQTMLPHARLSIFTDS
jgi:hypothetical protein